MAVDYHTDPLFDEMVHDVAHAIARTNGHPDPAGWANTVLGNFKGTFDLTYADYSSMTPPPTP